MIDGSLHRAIKMLKVKGCYGCVQTGMPFYPLPLITVLFFYFFKYFNNLIKL